ncbi:MAG: hypothetical protein R3Y58_00020 [Eubacteriales bacterium]
MNEVQYKKKTKAQKRIISNSEMEQLQNMGIRSYAKKTSQKRKNKRQFGLYAISVIVLALAIIIMCFYLLFFTQKVEVRNNEYSTDMYILNWLAADPVSTNTIATFVKYNYWDINLPGGVDSICVELNNPWEVAVLVEDKQPVSGFEIEGKYVYCDEDGTVILEVETSLEGVPLIEGIEVTEYALYEIIQVEDVDIFQNVLEVTSILNTEEISVDTISCGGAADVDITIGNKLIKLGEGNYEEKIVQIPPILEKISEEEGTLNLENYSSSNATVSFTRKISEN